MALYREHGYWASRSIFDGTDAIRLWHDQLLYKPPQQPGAEAPKVGWHTDKQSWKSASSEAILTAWVPFHDCEEDVGTITMIDGSHRWPDNTEKLDFHGGGPRRSIAVHIQPGENRRHDPTVACPRAGRPGSSARP